MKVLQFSGTILMFIFGFTSALTAHQPSDIVFTFDAGSKIIKADIIHNVKDFKEHYIRQIVLYIY